MRLDEIKYLVIPEVLELLFLSMETGKFLHLKNKINDNICKETMRSPIILENETPRVKN